MAKKLVSLAFSGSGFLAPVHAGFAVALMENGYKIVEVAGTSGGSIVAAAIATGKNVKGLTDMVFTDFPKGIADFSVLSGAYSLTHGGLWLNNGKILYSYLQSIFGSRNFNSLSIPLTVMATNLSENKTLEFSKATTPTLTLAYACRCSSSVPFVYKPMTYEGNMTVDGGVRNNIPTQKLKMGDTIHIGVRVLDGGNYKLTSVVGIIKQLVSSLLDANEDNLVAWAKSTGAVIQDVDCKPYDFLNAAMTYEQKLDLFNRGKAAAMSIVNS